MLQNNKDGIRTIAFESLNYAQLEFLRHKRITAITEFTPSQLRALIQEMSNAGI